MSPEENRNLRLVDRARGDSIDQGVQVVRIGAQPRRHVYVAADDDEPLTVFAPEPGAVGLAVAASDALIALRRDRQLFRS